MNLTHEQAEIRDSVATLRKGNNLKVIAFAGAGKTTTLKACAEARHDHGIYLAFNQSIAREAREKLANTKCRALTMHSLAYQVMRDGNYMTKPINLNARTFLDSGLLARFDIPKIRDWNNYRLGAAVIRTMSAFAASDDVKFSGKHAMAALVDSLGDPDFMGKKADETRYIIEKLSGPLHRIAHEYWIHSMKAQNINHDMYLKMLDIDENLRHNAFRNSNYIMIDEAQDINPVQRSILTKTGLPLVAVGDPYQQIYSWRGAENALKKLPGRELFLTESFRFGENIAGLARNILSNIPIGRPTKQLSGSGPGNTDNVSKQAVICRTNTGMLDEAIEYLNRGHSVHVDNVKGLLNDVLSAQALKDNRMNDVKSPDLKQFDSWTEMVTLSEEGSDPGLSKLVNLVKDGRIPDVKRLEDQHRDNPENADIVVYTGHRSKGLEFKSVHLGEDWFDLKTMYSRFKKAQEKSQKHVTLAAEAYNTVYVAATRAMEYCSGYQRIMNIEKKPKEQEETSAPGKSNDCNVFS